MEQPFHEVEKNVHREDHQCVNIWKWNKISSLFLKITICRRFQRQREWVLPNPTAKGNRRVKDKKNSFKYSLYIKTESAKKVQDAKSSDVNNINL